MKKEKIIDLSMLLMIPIVNIIYGFLNNDNRGYYMLVTEFDKGLPFIKEFVIPYVLWYPFIILCMVYFLQKSRKIYFRALFSLVAGYLTCYLIFFVFQTYVQRPMISGNDFFDSILKIVYTLDKPYNCFPSIHVVSCCIMIAGIFDMKESTIKAKIMVVISATIIIMSTQFIRQHVLMDVLSGMILGTGAYLVSRVVNWEAILCQMKSLWLSMTIKKSET